MVQDLVKKELSKYFNLDIAGLLIPNRPELGDYAVFKKSEASNIKSENSIIKELQKTKLFSKVELKGNFFNFFINPQILLSETNAIIKEKHNYGKNNSRHCKKIVVEFAHPNTHKMFHIGHLRNIITGEFICRILNNSGAEIIRANYQGDVGLHIAKALYPLLQNNNSKKRVKKLTTLKEKVKFLGELYATGSKAYEQDENVKKEIIEINKRLYDKNPALMPIYQQTRQWSLEYFDQIYKRLGSYFDRFYFESEVYHQGKKIVHDNLKNKVFVKSQGAIIFPGEKFGLHNRVFITKEGNPTYEAKDMALAELQFNEYHPDLIIHCVGPEQTGYFQVIFEALAQLLPTTRGREFHLNYGWVQLKHGKMSSRLGNVITGEWLLDTVKEKILQQYKCDPDIAEILSIAAVKYSILKIEPKKNIAFDINESINVNGNSGPYILYSYARCMSILDKSVNNIIPDFFQDPDKVLKPLDFTQNNSLQGEENQLLRTFIKYPEVILQAANKYAPQLICNYLFELCQKYNYFYEKCPIIKAPENKKGLRLLITAVTAQLINNGLSLLGIKTVKKI